MLDIKFIRENKEAVENSAKNKGYDVSIDRLIEVDDKRRQLQVEVDELRTKRNTLSGSIQGGRPEQSVIDEVKELKEKLSVLESDLSQVESEYYSLLKAIPNVSMDSVPVGASEDENVVDKTIGAPTVKTFSVKNHAEIAASRGWIDKERAAKVAGSRFAYIKGDMVKLQMALIQFAFDTFSDEHTIRTIVEKAGISDLNTKPFTPVLPPYFIKTELYDAMDRLEPREDRYKIEQEDSWLQGSAEHVLGSMHADEIIDETNLPIRYIGYATSFRREAGTYGKDMEGIMRMHQFDKLEFESFSTPENGYKEHLLMIALQEHILSSLGIPYRVIKKCTFDIGKPNASGVDMEAWLPGQNQYRETHTADYMTDYQSRRLKTRVRKSSGEVELVHTNDATAMALGRIMIAIIENYQNEDETVTIPEVLSPYLKNLEVL
jgi:seryl-tRNA synthetase